MMQSDRHPATSPASGGVRLRWVQLLTGLVVEYEDLLQRLPYSMWRSHDLAPGTPYSVLH